MADPDRIVAVQQRIREEVDCRLNETPCKLPHAEAEDCLVESDLDPPGVQWVCRGDEGRGVKKAGEGEGEGGLA